MNKQVYDRFCAELLVERKRQEEKHGETCFEIPDSTDNVRARETYETIARNSCNRAFKEGRLTNAHILDEEASEALTAAAKGDVEGLKKELVQTAAVCLAWLEAIEKRESEARGDLKPGDKATGRNRSSVIV